MRLQRLKADEAAEVRFDEWLARRHYMQFAASDRRHCDAADPSHIRVEYRARPDLGTPSLTFALDGAYRADATGWQWSAPDSPAT